MKCSLCGLPSVKGFILGKNTNKPYCFQCSGSILIESEKLSKNPLKGFLLNFFVKKIQAKALVTKLLSLKPF